MRPFDLSMTGRMQLLISSGITRRMTVLSSTLTEFYSQNMEKQQPKHQKPQRITMELHPAEALLIQKIRAKYPFGELTIKLKDGLPLRIKATVEESLWVSPHGDIIKE
jgi:hypothetical protein